VYFADGRQHDSICRRMLGTAGTALLAFSPSSFAPDEPLPSTQQHGWRLGMNRFGQKSDVKKHLSHKVKKHMISSEPPLQGVSTLADSRTKSIDESESASASVVWSREKLIDRRLP